MPRDRDLKLLLVGLRTRRRPVDLLSVAGAVDRLIADLGSTRAVATRAQVSPSMVGRFRSILKLGPPVKELVQARSIDRVSDAHQLSRIEDGELQFAAASALSEYRLTTKEVRDLVTILLRTRSRDPATVAKKIRDSRRARTRLYVVLLAKAKVPSADTEGGLVRILRVLHRFGVQRAGLKANATSITVVLRKAGYRRLAATAERRGEHPAEYLETLLSEGVPT